MRHAIVDEVRERLPSQLERLRSVTRQLLECDLAEFPLAVDVAPLGQDLERVHAKLERLTLIANKRAQSRRRQRVQSRALDLGRTVLQLPLRSGRAADLDERPGGRSPGLA